VLAVVKKYVKNNPGITMRELTQAFTHPQLPVIIVPYDEAQEIYERTGHRRHFVDEPITLTDTKIAINNQWGAGGIVVFIELAERLGYSIESANQTEGIRGWIRTLLREAKERGDNHIDIKAGDVIRSKLQGANGKAPQVCSAMKSVMRDGDEILYSPPGGASTRFTVRYYLREE